MKIEISLDPIEFLQRVRDHISITINGPITTGGGVITIILETSTQEAYEIIEHAIAEVRAVKNMIDVRESRPK